MRTGKSIDWQKNELQEYLHIHPDSIKAREEFVVAD